MLTAQRTLSDLLSKEALQDWAGRQVFERGDRYYREGRVNHIVYYNEQVRACVEGRETYTVKLARRIDGLEYSCDCPMGEDGFFCKHLVAAGLALSSQKRKGRANMETVVVEGIHNWLLLQSKEFLAETVIEAALDNFSLLEALSEKMSSEFEQGHCTNTLQEAFGRTTCDDDETSLDFPNEEIDECYEEEEGTFSIGYEVDMDFIKEAINTLSLDTIESLRNLLFTNHLSQEDDAVVAEVLLNHFEEFLDMGEFQLLRKFAVGCGQWDLLYPKVLEKLRRSIAQETKNFVDGKSHHKPDHSSLVNVFLNEGNIESAWKEAKAGGCADSLWAQLAAVRERQDPEEALEVYRFLVERAVDKRKQASYHQAIEYLDSVKRVLYSLDRGNEYLEFVHYLQVTHKLKRNFIKLLHKELSIF